MKKKVSIIQDEMTSCGACCVASLVNYYDGYVPLYLIKEDTFTNRNGTTAFNLKEALEKYGFNVYGTKIPFDQITLDYLPCIAHVIKNGYEHFVVIYNINDKIVTIMDPEVGMIKRNIKDFKHEYDNFILVCKPINKIIKYDKKRSLITILCNVMKTNRSNIIKTAILMITSTLLSVIISLYIKMISIDKIIYITALMIIIVLMKYIINWIKNISIIKLYNSIDSFINKDLTKHVFELKMSYLEKNRVGEIIKKISEAEEIKDFFLNLIFNGVINLIFIIVLMVICFYTNYIIGLVIIAVLCIYGVIMIISIKKTYHKNKMFLNSNYNYYGKLTEYISGLKSIKNTGKTNTFLNLINKDYENLLSKRYQVDVLSSNILNFKILIRDLLIVMIIYIGYKLLSIVDIMVIYTMCSMIMSCFEEIIDCYSKYIYIKALFRPLSEFLDIQSENISGTKKITLNEIKMANISYTPDGLHTIFNNINININRGDKILIKGESGVGKSTLMKMLTGSIDNYHGDIYFDNDNIKNIDVNTIRKNIIYISQDETLFETSIKNNITLEDNNPIPKELLSNTLIDSIVSKKFLGLEEKVLEGASNISGGEKARIMLARALYLNPQVLIIDETLSALNASSEDYILKKLLDMHELTLIYITHREKEKYFKKIYEIKEGRVYEIRK